MKKTEVQELKSLSVEELKTRLAEAEASLDKLKFTHKISAIENPLRIRAQRKMKARLLTELHSRTVGVVADKVASGALTSANAREFLASEKLPTPMTLAKVKKIIGNAN